MIKIFRIVFFLGVVGCFSFASISTKSFLLNDFKRYEKTTQNARIQNGKILTSNINLENEKSKEFYLDFEPSNQNMFSSELPQYADGIIHHGVKITNSKNVLRYNGQLSPFFYHKNTDHDFTLSIYFNANVIHGYRVIIDKMGIISNNSEIFSEGFSFAIKNDKPLALFKNLFKFKDKRKDIILEAKNPIKPNRWYKMTVTFDSYEGILRLYLNSNLEDQKTASISNFGGAILYPSFSENNSSPLVVGGSNPNTTFNGYIDEFSVLSYKADSVYTEQYPQVRSSYTSKVFFLGYNKLLKQLNFEGENLNKERTFLYYKTSPRFFSEEDDLSQNGGWKKVDPNKPISGNIITESSFQPYVQFKIAFENADSRNPAVINHLEITYDELSLPTPKKIEASSDSSKTLNVVWESANDVHVTGYYVYYSKDHFVNDINYTFLRNEKGGSFVFQKQINFAIPNVEAETAYVVYVVCAGLNGVLSPPSEKKEVFVPN